MRVAVCLAMLLLSGCAPVGPGYATAGSALAPYSHPEPEITHDGSNGRL